MSKFEFARMNITDSKLKNELFIHMIYSVLFVPLYIRSPVPGPVMVVPNIIYICIYFRWWLVTAGSASPKGRLRLVELCSYWAHVMMALCPFWVTEFRDAGSLTPHVHVMYRRHGQVESSGVMLWYGVSMEVAMVPVR